MGKQKSGQRRCPLCAEVIKTDAARCRFCGSTLATMDGMDWSSSGPGTKDALGAGAGGWPAPAKGDVGAAGLGAVVGALGGFAVGAWFNDPLVPPAFALAGAAVGAFVARATLGART